MREKLWNKATCIICPRLIRCRIPSYPNSTARNLIRKSWTRCASTSTKSPSSQWTTTWTRKRQSKYSTRLSRLTVSTWTKEAKILGTTMLTRRARSCTRCQTTLAIWILWNRGGRRRCHRLLGRILTDFWLRIQDRSPEVRPRASEPPPSPKWTTIPS